MDNTLRNSITTKSKHNESYSWILPSADCTLDDIKNAKHGEMFRSPTFIIQSIECYFELYPTGCNDRTKEEIILFLCIQSIPSFVSTIISTFKISVKETNTSNIKTCRLVQENYHTQCWKRGTLHSNKITNLNKITFGIVMNFDKIYDVSGNIILNNNIDLNKDTLIEQMIFLQKRYDDAMNYLLIQQNDENRNLHITFDPGPWFYEVGIKIYDSGNWQKTINCLSHAKSDGDELLITGLSYAHMGDYKTAIRFYEKYLLEYPNQKTDVMDVPFEIGKALYEGRQYEAAIKYLSNITCKDCPGDELIFIGVSCHDMGDCKNAIKHYEEYMRKYPHHPTDVMNVPLNLGTAYKNIGDMENAKKYFLAATKLSKEDADGAWQQYANLLTNIDNNYDEALAIALQYFDENNAEHFIEIAQIYAKMGNKLKANDFWIKGLIKHPNNNGLNTAYAKYLQSIGKHKQTLYYYYKLQKAEPYRIDILASIMNTLRILNDTTILTTINKMIDLITKEYENNVDYKYNKKMKQYSDPYWWRLNSTRKVKIRALVGFCLRILGCLQSISVDNENKMLFQHVLNFVMKMNNEYPEQTSITNICEYLLCCGRGNEIQKIYEENMNSFDYKSLKTLALHFYQLQNYEKSIQICSSALNKSINNKMEHDYVSIYYLLCLNYLELNDVKRYDKYHKLAMELETQYANLSEWNQYFKFDNNNGKNKLHVFCDVTDELKYEFDANDNDHFEQPSIDLINKYKQEEKDNDNEVEDEDDKQDEKTQTPLQSKDINVIKYNDDKEWEIINLWFDKATSISAHETLWNELYIECLFDLGKIKDVIQFVKMFNLQNNINNSVLYQIGQYYYYKKGKERIALKYLDLIKNGENERILFSKARCFRKLKECKKAINIYKKILLNDAFYINCIEDLSDVYVYYTTNFAEARKLIMKALTLNHTHIGILDTFGTLLARVPNYSHHSLLIYTKKLHLNKNCVSFVNAGYNFYKSNELKKAIDVTMHDALQTEKKTKKISPVGVGNLGFYYYELYKKIKNNDDDNVAEHYLDQAQKLIKLSLSIDDKTSEFVHYFWANLLFFELKKYHFAGMYYTNSLRINANNNNNLFDMDYKQQCLLNYAKLLRILKDYEKSNHCLNEAINFKINYQDPNFEHVESFSNYNECYKLISLNYKDLGDDINSK